MTTVSNRFRGVLDGEQLGILHATLSAGLDGQGRLVDCRDVEASLLKKQRDSSRSAPDVQGCLALHESNRSLLTLWPVFELSKVMGSVLGNIDVAVIPLHNLVRATPAEARPDLLADRVVSLSKESHSRRRVSQDR
jgi:hypothetical protein